MGHKNYSKHFRSNREQESDTTMLGFEQTSIEPDAVLTESEVENLNENDVAEVQNDFNLIGIVTNCKRLNVRDEAAKTANILCTIDENEEVTIVSSNDEFYQVCTLDGVEGYCMVNFIEIK